MALDIDNQDSGLGAAPQTLTTLTLYYFSTIKTLNHYIKHVLISTKSNAE